MEMKAIEKVFEQEEFRFRAVSLAAEGGVSDVAPGFARAIHQVNVVDANDANRPVILFQADGEKDVGRRHRLIQILDPLPERNWTQRQTTAFVETVWFR